MTGKFSLQQCIISKFIFNGEGYERFNFKRTVSHMFKEREPPRADSSVSDLEFIDYLDYDDEEDPPMAEHRAEAEAHRADMATQQLKRLAARLQELENKS